MKAANPGGSSNKATEMTVSMEQVNQRFFGEMADEFNLVWRLRVNQDLGTSDD